MVNSEENITNLKDAKTRVTVGDSRTLTGGKGGNWHGYQRHAGKIHCVMLSNADIVSGLHVNLFRVMQILQKGFHIMSESKALILN